VTTAVSQAAAAHRVDTVGPGRVFLAVLSRDLFVTWRELPTFLVQSLLQPLFLLFVFGKVLSELGYTQRGYAQLLLPGIVAMTAFLTALQNTSFPLVIDFGFLKEIEDRLLAPLPTSLVAVEKIVFATLRALVGAILMFPVGEVVLGSVPWRAAGVPLVAVYLVLGAVSGAAIGLTLGTLVTPAKINIIFAVILTPLLFTGATQYPWALLDKLRWFQVVSACNPLTYVSEGLRAALEPEVPHISPLVGLPVLVGFIAVFMAIGIKGFRRRAID
jgi:ABC-2 type transport system permease protein